MEFINIMTITGRAISQPFLLLTFIYYWRVTKFHYLYRMCFMNYLVCLMISNVWNIWAISKEYQKKRPTYIFHTYNFIELSLLLWTNILCFNFWQNIKKLVPISSNSREERTTYIKCLIYVWSYSLLYTIVGFINDYFFKSHDQIYMIIEWVSFILPVIMLLSNVLMMINASIIIIKEMRAIKKVIGPNTTRNNDNYKKKLMLYCKLFMVSIFLLCSKWFWFRLDHILHTKVFYSIFQHLMVANSFQGLFIFLLFRVRIKKKRLMQIKISVSDQCTGQTALNVVNTPETPTLKTRPVYFNELQNLQSLDQFKQQNET